MNQDPIILFDGVCNLCNGIVKFIIKHDKDNVFRFASLQSSAGIAILKDYHLDTQSLASFILIDNGKAYSKSSAALKLFNKLPKYWKWTQLFWLIPRAIRDPVYTVVARNRYKWFGRTDHCMVPDEKMQSRFLM